jgi:hypothetical protein
VGLTLSGTHQLLFCADAVNLLGDNIDTVTCTSIARQRVGKHVPVDANARNNIMSVVRQRRCKQASLEIEDCVFRGVCAESYPEGNRRDKFRTCGIFAEQ